MLRLAKKEAFSLVVATSSLAWTTVPAYVFLNQAWDAAACDVLVVLQIMNGPWYCAKEVFWLPSLQVWFPVGMAPIPGDVDV